MVLSQILFIKVQILDLRSYLRYDRYFFQWKRDTQKEIQHTTSTTVLIVVKCTNVILSDSSFDSFRKFQFKRVYEGRFLEHGRTLKVRLQKVIWRWPSTVLEVSNVNGTVGVKKHRRLLLCVESPYAKENHYLYN